MTCPQSPTAWELDSGCLSPKPLLPVPKGTGMEASFYTLPSFSKHLGKPCFSRGSATQLSSLLMEAQSRGLPTHLSGEHSNVVAGGRRTPRPFSVERGEEPALGSAL